ncbi:uncharacterized protein N7483_008338 [Penicillium malachiteum]|uniref:uncharacterized protein n=1 Tax=Penicillium malachiteum TaxID=1324776 RepID=UPI002546AECF|nr:uncharacterized protein N7483_008338 [Penicillium malachiteum]KAJ5720404.1 hypothetical protein N7483_008338 [Penicillium malachiteum]
MGLSESLKIEPVTAGDRSALADLWLVAFSDSHSRQLFPDTPGVRKWLEGAIFHDIVDHPFQHYMKIIDPKSKNYNGGPPIVAYAKWDLSLPEERGPRYPPWHEDMPKELCEAFVARGESNRRRIMGNTKHIFEVLDIVVTHPQYQRRGAASMLMKWGCDQADIKRVSVYLSASAEGSALYAKFGFIDHGVPGQGAIPMVRPCPGGTVGFGRS